MPTVKWRTTDPKRLTEHECWHVGYRESDLAEAFADQSVIGDDQLVRQSRGPFRLGSL
jgi:hypothetical protein